MLKKVTLAAVAAATALTAIPAAADAQPNGRAYGYYNNSAHARGYDRNYDRGYYDNGYGRQSYGQRSYAQQGYDGGYYTDSRGYRQRCSGTTGTVIGGVAGALLGRTVTRDYRHSGTTGTILGGALGALTGRAVDKSSCRGR